MIFVAVVSTMLSSMMSSPIEPAFIVPEDGFFTLSIFPIISASIPLLNAILKPADRCRRKSPAAPESGLRQLII